MHALSTFFTSNLPFPKLPRLELGRGKGTSINILPRLPTPLGHLLGHRPSFPPKFTLTLSQPVLRILDYTIFFISIFVSLLIPQWVLPIPASFGAAAILIFAAPLSPLAQPRNAILSQVLSAFVGVTIGKIFEYTPSAKWYAGPLATATSGVAMRLTGTVHPPAGATALLAVITHERWHFLGVVAAGSVFMVTIQCIVGNLPPIEGRSWPVFWWSPQQAIMKLEEKGGECVVVGMEGVEMPAWMKSDGVCVAALEDVRKRMLERGGGKVYS